METEKGAARTEGEKAAVKARILEAAREMVVRDGFGALSIRKLADTIGYAPGTLYLYFRSRDEIAREICRTAFVELLTSLEPVAQIADPAQRLRALVEAYANFAQEHPETYKLGFMQDPKFSEALFRQTAIDEENGAGQKAFRLIVASLDELKQNGTMEAAADTTVLAETLWAGVHGIVSLKLIYPAFPATPTPVLVRTFVETFFAGLRVY